MISECYLGRDDTEEVTFAHQFHPMHVSVVDYKILLGERRRGSYSVNKRENTNLPFVPIVMIFTRIGKISSKKNSIYTLTMTIKMPYCLF